MTDTELTLYWATHSWLEKDVPVETGITDTEMCRKLWLEVQRVRGLFWASIQMPRLIPKT